MPEEELIIEASKPDWREVERLAELMFQRQMEVVGEQLAAAIGQLVLAASELEARCDDAIGFLISVDEIHAIRLLLERQSFDQRAKKLNEILDAKIRPDQPAELKKLVSELRTDFADAKKLLDKRHQFAHGIAGFSGTRDLVIKWNRSKMRLTPGIPNNPAEILKLASDCFRVGMRVGTLALLLSQSGLPAMKPMEALASGD